MYKVIYKNNYESHVGSLHDCLFYVAVMVADYARRNTVTVKQAVDAGYSIVRSA